MGRKPASGQSQSDGRRAVAALVTGACLSIAGIAGLTAGLGIAWIALILGVGLVGGVVPWLPLRPYLRSEAARSSERSALPRRYRGSLGFVPDTIERDTREMRAHSGQTDPSSDAEPA